MLLSEDQIKLSIAFHFSTRGQIERLNNIIEAYLRIFGNWEYNNWAKQLLMANFAYNNAKNASTNQTLFKLTFGYHISLLFKEDMNPHSKSRFADKLAKKLRDLIKTCC